MKLRLPRVLHALLALGLFRFTTQILSGAGVSESDGAWSETVDGLRGRLVAITGLNTRGSTEIGLSVELQNADAKSPSERTLYVNPDTSLAWALTDGHGTAVPPWTGQSLFGGWSVAIVGKAGLRFPASEISVPGDSVRRVPVCTGEYYLLDGPMALLFSQGLIGTPPWHISPDGHGPYSLSATFRGLDEGETPPSNMWISSLNLPPVRLSTDAILVVWQQRGVNSQKIGPQSTTLLGSIDSPDQTTSARMHGAEAVR